MATEVTYSAIAAMATKNRGESKVHEAETKHVKGRCQKSSESESELQKYVLWNILYIYIMSQVWV